MTPVVKVSPPVKKTPVVKTLELNIKLQKLAYIVKNALVKNDMKTVEKASKEINIVINKINLEDKKYEIAVKNELDKINYKIKLLRRKQEEASRGSKEKMFDIKRKLRVQKEKLFALRKREEIRITIYIALITTILKKLESIYMNQSESSNFNLINFIEKQARYYLFKLKSLILAQVLLMAYKVNFMKNSIEQLKKLRKNAMTEDEKKILIHKIYSYSKIFNDLNIKLKQFKEKSNNDIKLGRYVHYLDEDGRNSIMFSDDEESTPTNPSKNNKLPFPFTIKPPSPQTINRVPVSKHDGGWRNQNNNRGQIMGHGSLNKRNQLSPIKSPIKFIKREISPSDLSPFNDIKYAIEPSVLKDASQDYNDIVKAFFNVLNNLMKIDEKELTNPNGEYAKGIKSKVLPLLLKFAKKYDQKIGAKLLKFFLVKHVTDLLDNFYTGPPINIQIPVPPDSFFKSDRNAAQFKTLLKEIFPFTFTYKALRNNKKLNASQIAPFKYLAKNIPSNIRSEFSSIYDDIIRGLMNGFNETVSKLPEINVNTIKNINPMPAVLKHGMPLKSKFDRISNLLASNKQNIVKSLFMINILPFLTHFYRGPKLQFSRVLDKFNRLDFSYPNSDSNKIFNITTISSPKSVSSEYNVQDSIKKLTKKIEDLSEKLNKHIQLNNNSKVKSITNKINKNKIKLNNLMSTLKPSQFAPFNNITKEIEPSLLPISKEIYDNTVIKFFSVLNKYPNITDSNVQTVAKDIYKTIGDYLKISNIFQKNARKIYRNFNYGNKLMKYFFLRFEDKNDFIKNGLPLLKIFYKGKININNFNGSISMNYPNKDSNKIITINKLSTSSVNYPNKDLNKIFLYNKKSPNTSSSIKKKVLPSDLKPFQNIVGEIKPYLNDAKKDYNRLVKKYFEIINKYPVINDANISKIKEDVRKNLYTELNNLNFPNKKYPSDLTKKITDKLLKYFVLNITDKNDFIQNVLPLLNNFYKGQINIKEFNLES